MEALRRTIETEVSDAGDGNYRAVARLTDPFHDIEVVVMVRAADHTIADASARMMRVPYAETCPNSLPRMGELSDVPIGANLGRAVRDAVGGDRGCPYLVELVVQACKLAMLASLSEQARHAVLIENDLDKFHAVHEKMGHCAGHHDLPADRLPAWLEREREGI